MSNFFETLTTTLQNSSNDLVESTVNAIPGLFQALVLLLVGLIVAGIVKSIVHSLLKLITFDKVTQKAGLNRILSNDQANDQLFQAIPVASYWIVLLTFLIAISKVLGLSSVEQTLNDFILYIPNIIAAVLVIVITLAAARLFKGGVIAGLKSAGVDSYNNTIGNVVQVAVITIGSLVALSQLGFDVDIISTNLTVIIIGFVGMLALSLGLGSRNLAEIFLSGYFTKSTFNKGQTVTIKGVTGKIKEMNNLGIILDVKGVEVFMTHKDLVN